MGKCIKHIQCPKCAELGRDTHKDNLGVYEDGSTYCFSCGFSSGSNQFYRRPIHKPNELNSSILLPSDSISNIPNFCISWLNSYAIDSHDILKQHILWSEFLQRLVFPIYAKSELLAWQGRYFGKDDRPKWYSVGISDNLLHILGPPEDSLVLVEDIISAIKVSKYRQVMPLFGSHISTKNILRLKSLGYKELIYWLDPDKRNAAIKFSNRTMSLGLRSKVIFSRKDPKEENIQEFV